MPAKEKNPAQLNKLLDWGRVELEWVENLRKQESRIEKERGRGNVTSSQEARRRFAWKAAGDQAPTSPTARSRGPLRAALTRDTDTAKAGLFFKASLCIIKGRKTNEIKISIMPRQLCCLLGDAGSEEGSGKAAATGFSPQRRAENRGAGL